jgi:glutamine phosphoribosylpyrophosphate amidotransferase
MVEWIAKDLGVTTLQYQFLDDMVKAIGLPTKSLCLYCWIGRGGGVQKDLQSYQNVIKKDILPC